MLTVVFNTKTLALKSSKTDSNDAVHQLWRQKMLVANVVTKCVQFKNGHLAFIFHLIIQPVIQLKVSYLKDIKFLWFTLGISGLLFTAYLWRVYKACHHISPYSIRPFVDFNLKQKITVKILTFERKIANQRDKPEPGRTWRILSNLSDTLPVKIMDWFRSLAAYSMLHTFEDLVVIHGV